MDQLDQSSQINNLRKSTRFIRKDIQASIILSNFFGIKKTIKCKLIDISSAGVQVSSTTNLKQNSKLTLVITFGDDNKSEIKAKIVRQGIIHHYLSKHIFPPIQLFSKNERPSLKSVHLMYRDKQISAKYHIINMTSAKILTFSPLDKLKQYSLLFSTTNGKKLTVNTQFENYQHSLHNTYGLKFDKPNDALGEHLLDTQTELIFK